MTNRKRIGVLMLCIGLILVLSVSTAFIAHEADHDCCGEDCPICQTIAVNIRLLRTVGLAVVLLAVLTVLLDGQAVRFRRNRYAHVSFGTLVSLKIRLND